MAKLNCKNRNCKRVSLEIILIKNETPVLRIKNRHDGKIHISEFDFDEIKKEFEKMRIFGGNK